MNFFQKRFLTLAAFIANISLTLTVAGVATFAWYTSNTSAKVTGDPAAANVTATSDIEVDKEFLNFNDDAKAGKSTTTVSSFTLGDYDKYIGQNKYTNSIIRATLIGCWTSSDDLYVDITCQDGHSPSHTQGRQHDYTSNVAQFKVLAASYKLDGDSTRRATGVGVADFDSSDLESTAADRYRFVTNYFETKGLPGTRFVSLHNSRLYKPSNKITLLVPSIGLSSEQTATEITVYLECSYNKELASFYNGPIKLEPDITEIKFYTGAHKTGAYVKVKDSSDIKTGNQYMITYDGFTSDDLNPAFDGSADSFNNNNNYRDVYVRANRIPHTLITENQDFSYASSGDNAKLVSRSGKTIGLQASGDEVSYTSGEGYIDSDDNYKNTMKYDSQTGNTTIKSDDESSRFLRFNPNDTHFKYYDVGQHEIGVYEYKSDAAQFITLQSITLDSYSASSSYGNPWTYTGKVYANYGLTAEGLTTDTVDITDDPNLTISKAKIYEIGDQNITFRYTDPYYGVSKTVPLVLTITNPTTSLTIDTSNAKLYYIKDVDSFTKDGLIVYANKSDGSKVQLSSGQYVCQGFDNTSVGQQTITVSYTDETNTTVTGTFEITVVNQAETTATYIKLSSLSELHASDRVLITTCYTNNSVDTYYYLNASTTSTAPVATSFVESETDTISGNLDSNLFTVSKDGDNWIFTNNEGKYLHNTNDNNGVRINSTSGSWEITATSKGYKMTNNSRWLGVASNSIYDWRSYTTSDSSYYCESGESINFYKRVASDENVVSIYIADTKKTEYYTGDTFVEPVVYAVYENNSFELLTPTDYQKTPANPLSDDFVGPSKTQTVTISFGGKTASYDITVVRRIPTSISVTGQTTTFVQGGTFSFGGTATVTFNNGDEEVITPDFTTPDLSNPGTQTVTASYSSSGVTVSTTYTITITPRTPVSIEVSGYQNKFYVGDEFSYEGLVVTATFNSGDPGQVTPTSVSTPDMSSSGDKIVTVTYTSNEVTVSTTYTITVDPVLISITGEGVSESPKTKTAVIGMGFTFSATVTPSATINWTTSDASKVSISADHGNSINLTPLAKTTTAVTITAYATVNGTRYDDTVSVTVNYPTITFSPNGDAKTIYNLGSSNSCSVSAKSQNGHNVTWTMSPAGKVTINDLSIVTVNSEESVTIKAVSGQTGDVTITASADGGPGSSFVVHVLAPTNPTSLSILKNSVVTTAETVTIGSTLQLTASGSPTPTYKNNYIWESNNNHITVSQSGLVTVTNSATAGETANISLYFDANCNGTRDNGEATPTATCVITARKIITGTYALVSKSASTYYQSGDITGTLNTDATWTTTAFTATQTKNNGSNAVTLDYNEIRIYTSHTISFVANSNFSITSIEFSGSSSNNVGNLSTSSGYSYNDQSYKGTWTGNASSVTFTASAQARVNKIVVTYSYSGTQTISSIQVKTAPDTTSYTVGDTFDPTGLVITVNYNIGTPDDVSYAGNEGDFSFSPSTSTQLTTSNTSVTITYGGKTCNQTISVASETPTYYTVTFESNGGSSVSQITNVTSGSTISAPTAPTKTNFVFDGWYKESTLTTAWDFSNDTVTSDIILYAKWSAQQSEHETSDTYTFTNNQWNYGSSSWTHSANGFAKDATRGVQLTTSQNNIIICSPTSYRKIQKVVVTYAGNSSKGKGTIYAYYRSSSSPSSTGTLIGSTSINRPGASLKTTTFTPSSLSTTDYVQIKVAVTENSLYIYSVQVYYMVTS